MPSDDQPAGSTIALPEKQTPVQKALPLIRNGGSVILLARSRATRATRTWTREFNERSIRFNTSSPGPIDTPNELATVRFSLKA
jgi:hypothetical protein